MTSKDELKKEVEALNNSNELNDAELEQVNGGKIPLNSQVITQTGIFAQMAGVVVVDGKP